MRSVAFWKLYAEGNSYVVVNEGVTVGSVLPWVNDPRRGLGGDGLIVRARVGGAVWMRLFNADGSEASMCGNGARCLAALEYASGAVDAGAPVTVRCSASTVVHRLLDHERMLIEARMTVPAAPHEHRPQTHAERCQLDLGVPQLVIFRELATVELARDGPALERSRAGGTNVMFTSISAPGVLDVLPWERGAGAVAGCATGAAAAAIAAAARASDWPASTTVRQPGGTIDVVWDAASRLLQMRGTVRTVACGRMLFE